MGSDSGEKKGFAKGFWSDDQVTEIFLKKRRQIIWNKDYWRSILVPLLNLRQDSVVLDVGCGMGFIGQNLAEYVPEGKIIGIDLDAKLIELARKVSEKFLPDRVFEYQVGDACDLPVESNKVDLSICQCLLMHLDNPRKAIEEMRRVTKTGGRVVAIEPDYASSSYFDTAAEEMHYSFDQRVSFLRWEMLRKLGKKKLGKGDDDIGTKIPFLFHQAGLSVVDVRSLDRILWLVPPYQREGNDIELEHVLFDPEFIMEKLDRHRDFLSGGGTEDEYREYIDLLKKENEIRRQQVEEKTYISSVAEILVITVGEKA